ncbi:MAG: cupin domain-containing protein [Deltaproteobacteria bacterium]|nr:MAG: cupin domain-containing protein [Deltaproteobacteria bacterium]
MDEIVYKPQKAAYLRWMEQEGIPIFDGLAVEDVTELPRKPWARMGGSGSYIQLKGSGGVTGMYVVEIPPGGALEPERHMYDELLYVLKGRGSTEVWYDGMRKQAFEWSEGSLFAPPLNTWHRHYTARASRRFSWRSRPRPSSWIFSAIRISFSTAVMRLSPATTAKNLILR